MYFAHDVHTGLIALTRLSSDYAKFFSLDEISSSWTESANLLIRLTQAIVKGFRQKFIADEEASLAFQRCCLDVILAMLTLLHNDKMSDRLQSSAEDLREYFLSLTCFFISQLEQVSLLYTIFRQIVVRLKSQVQQPDVASRAKDLVLLGNAKCYISLLISFENLVDHDHLFEQELVRSFRKMGTLEQELWILGIIKKWISFA